MRTLPALLTHALPEQITDPHQLPTAPPWFPLDPADGPALSDTERAKRRHAWCVSQALEGPYDGQRMRVAVPDGADPPARFTPRELPTVWYVLDRDASNPHQLVYRYDPGCWLHPQLMAAVTEAFRDHTDTDAQEARTDDQDAPGYAAARP